ncbi:MAG TPA: 50S ribosomal protein L25/general stress protein Ctc [Nevskiaceae bacterium]|nr:50S ribosomal protein L25/general stress protein Ctc [Nevskiaceae bacterium]
MKESFVVNAQPRVAGGTGASRRLRKTGQVPAILYGGKDQPAAIQVSANEMWKHLQTEAFYSHILTLKLEGQEQQVVLKDMQRHPVTENPMHIDFQRVLADVALRMQVPLHFKGSEVAPGIKTGGGIVEHHMNSVEVECLPRFLPEFIEVDMSAMELNQSIHLSQLKLSEGVALVELKHGKDPSVVAIHLPRAVVEEEPAAAEAPSAEVPATAQKAPEAAEAGKGDAKKDEKKDKK